MTPIEERNQKLAQELIKQLNRRHIEAFYCPTGEEAVKKVSELIADGSTVTWGGTATVRDLGIPAMLKNRGTLQVLDRDEVETPEEKQEMYLKAFSADVYLTSANAISEDGVIVNIDGNGNRIAAISWGPKRVIFVIGLNKVAQTVEAALARARGIASPINSQRFEMNTPCKLDGKCHNCNSPESICSYVHFLRNSRGGGRHIVVLVGENLGY
ncbi:MAG: lactate utilization protein [Prevotella sp.]|jgi:L-lactate utilization protein LutB|nr:lactate utilization protein [Prevotella sp.]